MSGYYGWKPTSAAEIHLRESEQRAAMDQYQKDSIALRDRSRIWLDEYMSKPRPTNFNWSPRYTFNPSTITEKQHAQEAEEAFIQTAQAAANIHVSEGLGDAAAESGTQAGSAGTERQQQRPGQPEPHDWISDPIPF